jgi:hypothetical protein
LIILRYEIFGVHRRAGEPGPAAIRPISYSIALLFAGSTSCGYRLGSKLAQIFGKIRASRLTNLANSVDKVRIEGVVRESAQVKVSRATASELRHLHP